MRELLSDPLIDCHVTIRSVAGIDYSGVVRSIGPDMGCGELFELRGEHDDAYQRLVHVTNRCRQIIGMRPRS